MITSTSPVKSALPAETSILGTPSPSDAGSSFADQLANAVRGVESDSSGSAGSATITGTPRQNSDGQQLNFGNAGAPASGSPPVQFSFFQYLIDTAPAAGNPSTAAAPAANGASSASTPSAASAPPSGAPASSSNDPEWLSPPYYTPPAATFVSWENPPGVTNTTATPESDLQNLAAQFINDPVQFVWGGVPATTPQELIDNFVSYAQSRAATYPEASPQGYDPVATGTKYANLVLDSLQKIPYDTVGSSPYASIYDAWVAGVNTFPGASGTSSAG
jgi:hypothetical protein